jgi:hypothetical protein
MVSEQERYQDSGERVYTTLQTHSLRLAHRNQVVPVSLSNSHTSQLTHALPKSYALDGGWEWSGVGALGGLGLFMGGGVVWVRWVLVDFAQSCEVLV